MRSHWAKRMYKAGIRRLVYVPDADGQDGLEAAIKISSVFLAEGIRVIIAPMPEGYDPADLGKESYKELRAVVRQVSPPEPGDIADPQTRTQAQEDRAEEVLRRDVGLRPV